MNREAIMGALFTLASSAAPFLTTGRRLVLWSQCPDQPALFLRNCGDEYPPRVARGLPAKVTILAELWIYVRAGADPAVVPGTLLNQLIDAVEAVLAPSASAGVQTLGGLVSHCWIEGRIEYDPGDIDGQAKAIIPIRIVVPA